MGKIGKNKGKILKIKEGYNPNCSSGMWVLWIYVGLIFMIPVILGGFFAAISSLLSRSLYKRHIAKYGFKRVIK